MSKLPGGELASRPLHFIFVVDCSGSMAGQKIQVLNHAVRESIPHMRKVAQENPNAKVLIRSLKFSKGAIWHVSQPTDVESFEWTDLQADGQTDMGKAMILLSEALKMSQMPDRALPPVLVLLSDGEPSEPSEYDSGLKTLLAEPWGKKSVRLAIAIGDDVREETLRKFIDNPEIPVLKATNPEQLVAYIRWASTAVLKAASNPATQSKGAQPGSANVPVPPAPTVAPSGPNDVW